MSTASSPELTVDMDALAAAYTHDPSSLSLAFHAFPIHERAALCPAIASLDVGIAKMIKLLASLKIPSRGENLEVRISVRELFHLFDLDPTAERVQKLRDALTA